MRLEKGLHLLHLAQQVKLMKKENVDKGDTWNDAHIFDLYEFAMLEMAEVAYALHQYQSTESGSEDEKKAKHDLILECADVANFLAMICENIDSRG